LPKDLSAISVAGGHVIARPMDGAVEGMLSVLEDPRVEDAASALAGLISKYRTDGSKALRPFQDRFRKLLTDQDQGIRRVAAWSLARTGDLSMALPLIDALKDPDEGVVEEARLGLQLLSRKIESLGPPAGATPELKEQAIQKWKAWYETVRPLAITAEDPLSGKSSQSSRRLP
jgi:HEAT repeat protein